MEYYISQDGAGFRIAKFGDRDIPDDVYYISKRTCTCPSPKSPCKHVLMLREWHKLEVPEDFYFDDVADAFIEYAHLRACTTELLRKALHDGEHNG